MLNNKMCYWLRAYTIPVDEKNSKETLSEKFALFSWKIKF